MNRSNLSQTHRRNYKNDDASVVTLFLFILLHGFLKIMVSDCFTINTLWKVKFNDCTNVMIFNRYLPKYLIPQLDFYLQSISWEKVEMKRMLTRWCWKILFRNPNMNIEWGDFICENNLYVFVHCTIT